MHCHLQNSMSKVVHLRIQGSEGQAKQFHDNCRRTEALFAGTLMNRFKIPMTDENADLVMSWFKSVRDMATANWISSGMKASNHEHAMPRIVCLCGSTRFYEAFQQVNYERTMAGDIVLSVGFYPHSKAGDGHGEGVGHDSAEKVKLDELHKRKIDLADEILVLNVGGYIGESTRSEIAYALDHGKPVRWLEDPSDELCREFGVLTTPPRTTRHCTGPR